MRSKRPAVPRPSQGADPLLGTWKLNLAKSNYHAVPWTPPRSAITTFLAPERGEIGFILDEVPASGEPIHVEWGGKYDGKDYPATGSIYFDSAAVKRSGAGNLAWTLKKGGKLAFTGASAVSQDGKTLTMTSSTKNLQGETTTEVQVYDKELADSA